MSYYYDYETEPNYPEVEEIIEEATEKFSGFLNNAFIDKYKGIQVARENTQTKERLLREQEQDLAKKRNELDKRESALLQAEEVQYEKLKAKWFTELGLNFDIGDTVYYYKDVTKRVVCPTCNGNKKVNAKVESANNTLLDCKLECPTCNGWGTILGEKEYEIIEATVSEINANIRKTRDNSINIVSSDWCGKLTTYIWVRDKKGGDSLQIQGHDLHKTKEEAEAHIKELLKKD